MIIIGITGPSGSGKGVVSEILFENYGFDVIDADMVYHRLVSSPSECLFEIKDAFGDGVIKEDALDRPVLASLVFGDGNEQKLELLNNITHKYVVKEIKRIIEEDGRYVIDAPLLIEAGLSDICDLTVAVIADKETRIKRIALRDGISVEDASRRISSQKNDDFYIENTDRMMLNDGDLLSVNTSIERILSEWGFTE